MENRLGKVKQVKLQFLSTNTWLSTKKREENLKCENCNKLHKKDNYIAIAILENRVINAHICQKCGKFFIEQGAVDIDKAQSDYKKETKILKEKAKQLNIYGIDSMDNEQLKKAIEKREKENKKLIEEYKDNTALLSMIKEFNIDLITFLDSYSDYLSECHEVIDRESHRWWDEVEVVQQINDKYFKYRWATANRDESVEDLGWNFDFNSIVEVIPVKKIIETVEYKEV